MTTLQKGNTNSVFVSSLVATNKENTVRNRWTCCATWIFDAVAQFCLLFAGIFAHPHLSKTKRKKKQMTSVSPLKEDSV